AEEFARNLGQVSDEQLAGAINGPMREQILGEIFARMAEHYKGGGPDAVVHWKIGGRPDGGEDHWELVIKDGVASTTDRPQSDPRVTLKVGGVDFLKLVTGNANGPMMFMSGKLKIEGDLMFSAQIQSMFTIPGGAAGSQPAGAETA
ncbi:MAG: SCP2 sterol-binding domain-containing protein, partial [Chloroflexota bacterium]|nr:SCP2 sterol-binding domain-containing protein [Chloroflexota bacterium]